MGAKTLPLPYLNAVGGRPPAAFNLSVRQVIGFWTNDACDGLHCDTLKREAAGGKTVLFDEYDPGDFYDELIASPGQPRRSATAAVEALNALSTGTLQQKQGAALAMLYELGATFSLYENNQRQEQALPFDVVPRVVPAADWDWLAQGLKQRIEALNCFLADIYGEQKILRDRVVPRHAVESSPAYLQACQGLRPPKDIWCPITGADLIRDRDGSWYVLEDNLRFPSGMSYALVNRRVMQRLFPQMFAQIAVEPISDYPSQVLETLLSLAPENVDEPRVAVLTGGVVHSSAHFGHAYLAQQAGISLVEGQDLVVEDGYLYMRTVGGLERVDVLYRRIDDEDMDPQVFRADSCLGVPGLMEVYRQGRVAIANAPGTGVADDKLIYAYVPEMVRYYLGETLTIPNVPTYLCEEPKQQAHVLANLDKLVVKATNSYGGFGMLMGPQATPQEREVFAEQIIQNPRGYIAQPTLSLSRVPTLQGDRLEGCHVDLRPYVLYRQDAAYVSPGGLTRVALKKGSLVVNSSQGGGGKDTWIVSPP